MQTRPVRRVVVTALVSVMALIATANPAAAAFSDVGPNHPFRTEITWAVNNGIVNGYADGTFRGTNQVTRQAAAAFLYRFAAVPTYTPPAVATFPDVPTSYEFFKEIEWMVAAQLTTGYTDGRFRPGNPVTRQAMATFLWRIAGAPTPGGNPPQVFNDVPKHHQFYVPILWVWAFYIADGYATPFGWVFKPGGVVSRQAATAFIYRFNQELVSSAAAPEQRSTPQGLQWNDAEPSAEVSIG